MTDGEIAKRMGRTRPMIQLKRRAAALAPGRSPKQTAMLARINLRRLMGKVR